MSRLTKRKLLQRDRFITLARSTACFGNNRCADWRMLGNVPDPDGQAGGSPGSFRMERWGNLKRGDVFLTLADMLHSGNRVFWVVREVIPDKLEREGYPFFRKRVCRHISRVCAVSVGKRQSCAYDKNQLVGVCSMNDARRMILIDEL